MTNHAVYEQFDNATRNLSAYVILKGEIVVAKVVLKWATSGTRTTAFVHWYGTQMAKGVANGAGYDKASASVAAAARKIPDDIAGRDEHDRAAFLDAAMLNGGKAWDNALRDAGFTVHQAV